MFQHGFVVGLSFAQNDFFSFTDWWMPVSCDELVDRFNSSLSFQNCRCYIQKGTKVDSGKVIICSLTLQPPLLGTFDSAPFLNDNWQTRSISFFSLFQ
ncbi:hypothetical protein BLOT_007554 [Blomia tropicalis]|nr:hypothetical protein BLOT_007554 [Blomia tropicalis]